MTTAPQITPEQRQAALEKAKEARTKRAELKARIKSGEIGLAALLESASTDSIVGKMKVASVLESLPGHGKAKAAGLMNQIGITDTRRLQGLGARQKAELLRLAG